MTLVEFYSQAAVEKQIKNLVYVALTTDNFIYADAMERGNILFFQEMLLEQIKQLYASKQ